MTSQYVNYDEYRPGFNPDFLLKARQRNQLRAKLARLMEKVEKREREEALKEQERRRAEIEEEAARYRIAISEYAYRSQCDIVIERACKVFGVKPSELKSARRNKRVSFARQFCFYWISRRTNLSLPQIGRRFGGKDHTTVLHGKRVYPVKRAKMGRFLREVL
jgi:chromosomal replication initiation ATPase DnaA